MTGFAQTSEPLTLLWKVQADDPQSTYILSTSNAQRGMFLNPTAGGSLLVASRDNGNFVRRLDPATGALKDPAVIPTNGYITAETTFAINKVVVSDDGVIYVMSLGVASGTQNFRIYRHPNELTAETLVHEVRTDAAGANARIGDDADIIGSGNNTKILVAGASGGGIHLFTTADNGMTWTRTQLTGNPAFPTATPHIAWDPTVPNRFWFRGAGGAPNSAYDIVGTTANAATGPGNVLPDAVQAPAYGPFDVGLFDGVQSVALGIGASAATTAGKPVIVYRLSDLVETHFGIGSEFTGGAKANGNAAGDLYLDSANNVLYGLYTNNSVYKFGLTDSSVGGWSLY